jgi:acetyl-CoA carboxylase alpha subunit
VRRRLTARHAFAAIAEARVPVTTLVIGEGGSGGAPALAAPDSTYVTRDLLFRHRPGSSQQPA